MKFGRSKQPRLTREQALAAHPVRNSTVAWEETEAGEIQITIKPRQDRMARVLRWFFPPAPEKRIVLDEVGSQVWRLCDGRTSVDQIIRQMVRRYKLNRKEAEISTTEYLRRLGKRHLVGFALTEEQAKARS